MAKSLELEKQSNFMAEPLNTNPNDSKEVDDEMIKPTASLEHTPRVPYEVRTEGPLTYFHYYFEEVDATADHGTAIEQHTAAKFLPSRFLIGAGVLTATALSGLAIAGINKSQVSTKPTSPEPRVQQNSPKATDATKRLNFIGTAVQPLQANQLLWSSQLSPDINKTPNTRLAAVATPLQPGLKNAPQQHLATDQSGALGTLPQPLQLSPLSLSKTMGGTSDAQKLKSASKLSQTGLQLKPIILPKLKPTEPQPLSSPQSLSGTPVPTGNKSNPDHRVAGISRPETLAPQASDASTRSPAPVPMPAQAAQLFPLLPVQPMVQANQRLETSLPQQGKKAQNAANLSLSEENAAKESVEALNTPSVLPQSVQDLLNQSRPLPTDKVVTVVPLTQKAAEDVLAIKKVVLDTVKAGRFSILHLNLQDYQQAWLARNKVNQQLGVADAFPTYGFVDYQDRVIVVLD